VPISLLGEVGNQFETPDHTLYIEVRPVMDNICGTEDDIRKNMVDWNVRKGGMRL